MMPTLETFSTWAEQVLSPRLGLGRALVRVPRQAGEPRIHMFSVEPALLGPLENRPSRQACGGAGLTLEEARSSAVGELLEGYCAAFMDAASTVFGTYRELSRHHEVLEPGRFALFSDHQYAGPGFPFQRFTEDTPLSWVWGRSLVRRRPVLLPASRVYMPSLQRPGEADLGPIISTGLGAGSSLERAILSGLYECLERDAFTLFWMNDLPVRRIRLRGETPTGRIFRERFAVPGYEYRAYDLTLDLGVPTTYVVLTCQTWRGPLHVVGAASRLDGDQATLKALLEAVQGRPYVLWQLERHSGWKPAADFSNVTDFSLSCMLYSVVEELTPHLLEVDQRVTSELALEDLPRWEDTNPATALAELVHRLEVRGYELVVVDLTTPDIESLGLKVVRVVTPELQPLHGDHRWPFLGGKRLHEVPLQLGYRHERASEEQLTRYPHPFP
ncbi:YcaO-like family protein [Archangium lansingense]|uniref:YcaO-like family protein n=1 Tax=Archangium lansingense TaxID=2995310 RepID=A0ABT4AP74_9BACT|nr:YcaO-like family protein [Archangium lansinium]MCY1083396.1 YcaO-like family protein [Archangium lansinium]